MIQQRLWYRGLHSFPDHDPGMHSFPGSGSVSCNPFLSAIRFSRTHCDRFYCTQSHYLSQSESKLHTEMFNVEVRVQNTVQYMRHATLFLYPLKTFKDPRNRFQRIDSASLRFFSRYDNPILPYLPARQESILGLLKR
jgi:hypothetical protein